jgi:hypothetical protein
MMAWVGFGCCVMALASLSVSFCSPYWIQTWPNSENKFRNMGLWHVCFHDYMQFKDDSQTVYSTCWWVFDSQTRYSKLQEWLTPPWFISCQVLVVGCLVIDIATCLVTASIFLHCCPIMNHEYLQTYGIFASASMMLLVSMVSLVVAILFGVQTNDRYWMPRPDQNYLSWGFGFLIINAIFALASGVVLFMEGQNTYNALLRKEDEYTRAALEMSAYPLQEPPYPPVYESQYGPGNGAAQTYAPNYGPRDGATYGPPGIAASQNAASFGPGSGQNSFEKEPLYEKDREGSSKGAADSNGDDKRFRSFDERPTSYTDDRYSFPPLSPAKA